MCCYKGICTYSLPVVNACNCLRQIYILTEKFKVSTKSMYKIQVARVKLSNLISKFKFIYTNQMSIHLFPVMHLYALQVRTKVKAAGVWH